MPMKTLHMTEFAGHGQRATEKPVEGGHLQVHYRLEHFEPDELARFSTLRHVSDMFSCTDADPKLIS